MLRFIQIAALFQGVFLLIVLLVKRDNYKRLNFWLLFATIVSLLFHIVGDDDFNLILPEANWYIFQSPLIITLFFLLIKYHNSKQDKFQVKDVLYFIPYLGFIILQFVEGLNILDQNFWLVAAESLVGVALLLYLGYTIYVIIKNKKEQWMLFFLVPYTLIYFAEGIMFLKMEAPDSIPFLESYGVIGLSALLLYTILFVLIVSPKTVLPKADAKPYKTSSLSVSKVNGHKKEFLRLMTEEKLFKDSNLTVNQVAQKMGIPRQHLSEILNVHMKYNFQDYINKCRAEEFAHTIKDDKYKNYTIMAIANEVGFKSKSSFNTTFKKHYGVTPSEFKKKLNLL